MKAFIFTISQNLQHLQTLHKPLHLHKPWRLSARDDTSLRSDVPPPCLAENRQRANTMQASIFTNPQTFKTFELELELELIQTHMTQKPVLRVEAGARALRVLIKKNAVASLS